MVAIGPFVGVRPSGELAARTVDGSLNAAARWQQRSRHQHSVAWLESWDEGPVASVDGWLDAGELVADDRPVLRLVEHTGPDGHRTLGLLGAVPPTDLLPHEGTDADAVARRITRDRGQELDVRPVLAVLAEDPPALTELVASVLREPPSTDVVDEAGHRHRVRVLDPTMAAAAIDAVAATTALLADGHHRVAAAVTLGRPLVMTLVCLASAAPVMMPVHRIGATSRQENPELRRWLASLPSGTDVLLRHGDDRVEVAAAPGELPVTAAHRLAGAAPGSVSVTHTTSEQEATAALEAGAVVTVGTAPTIAEVVAAVRGGTSLPPKSTAFHPKPRAGLVMMPFAPPPP